MKNIKIYNKQNETVSDLNRYEDPTDFINHIVGTNYFGKPERWVRKKREGTNEFGEPTIIYPDEVYDDLDVLGEEERPLFPDSEELETYVQLKAEYSIEITDVTEELGKAKCKAEAKKLIAELDWVLDTETQPLLSNRSEFIAYRSQLRQLIITPQVDPVFPNRPDEVWAD